MYQCPACHDKLIRTAIEGEAFWSCISCHGRIVQVDWLKNKPQKSVIQKIISASQRAKLTENRKCSICLSAMHEFAITHNDQSVHLDSCQSCRLLWFDTFEYERVMAPTITDIKKMEVVDKRQPDKNKDQFDQVTAQEILAANGLVKDGSEGLPPRSWEYLLGFMGLPVQRHAYPSLIQPWTTWILSLFIVLFSLYGFSDPESVFETFAFHSDRPFQLLGLTNITSFFLHGGYWHLIGNLYFFLVFGDDVEEYLGSLRYVLLIFSAVIIGHIFYAIGQPNSPIPVIGASGGIFGILVFYALQFPKSKLMLMFYFRMFHLPVLLVIGLYIFQNVIGSVYQVYRQSNVSSLSHLGGGLAGFLFWWFWKSKKE